MATQRRGREFLFGSIRFRVHSATRKKPLEQPLPGKQSSLDDTGSIRECYCNSDTTIISHVCILSTFKGARI